MFGRYSERKDTNCDMEIDPGRFFLEGFMRPNDVQKTQLSLSFNVLDVTNTSALIQFNSLLAKGTPLSLASLTASCLYAPPGSTIIALFCGANFKNSNVIFF